MICCFSLIIILISQSPTYVRACDRQLLRFLPRAAGRRAAPVQHAINPGRRCLSLRRQSTRLPVRGSPAVVELVWEREDVGGRLLGGRAGGACDLVVVSVGLGSAGVDVLRWLAAAAAAAAAAAGEMPLHPATLYLVHSARRRVIRLANDPGRRTGPTAPGRLIRRPGLPYNFSPAPAEARVMSRAPPARRADFCVFD